MKLDIKNFQSITNGTIDFPIGITCLCGESNQGKTSILRAIRALVLNPQGSKHYIQHGKDKAEVTLTNNGQSLTWERTKSTSNYKYNGEEFTKCSRQSAKDFCDLGFIIDERGNLLNLSDEWSTLYPFYMSDAELFKHFEELFNIIDSAKIVDSMKGDENSCNRDKLLTQDRLNDMLKKKETVEKIFVSVEKTKPNIIKAVLEKKIGELDNLKKDYEIVESLNKISQLEVPSKSFNTDNLIDLGKSVLELYKACSCFSELPLVPNPKSFDLNTDALAQIMRAEIDYQTCERNKSNLSNAQIELETTLEKLNKEWSSIDTCPLCGGAMNG